MSHFSVAVFHREDQSIESLLAPYNEELQVAPYVKYTRQEAIAFAKKHISGCDGMTDDKCWELMAEDCITDQDGNIYSKYNPDSKWDWWEVGGRFNNMLQVGKVLRDEAYVKDIDFSRDDKTYKDALDFWDVVIDGKLAKPGKNYDTFLPKKYYEDYYGDRETYANYMSHFSTYAVITPDGRWYSEGKMGWFGHSSASPEEFRKWHEHYEEIFLKNAAPDWVLTIVDCHI